MVLCMDLSEISASAFEATKPWPDPTSSSGSLCSLCRRPRPGCSYPASPRSTTSWWRQPKSRWRCFYTSSLVIWLLLESFWHLNFKKWKNQVGSKKLFFSFYISFSNRRNLKECKFAAGRPHKLLLKSGIATSS